MAKFDKYPHDWAGGGRQHLIRNGDLFDRPAAQAARDAAVAQVAIGKADWIAAALDCVRQVAERHPQFTTDHVKLAMAEAGLRDHAEPRAWGAVMTAARRAGLCTPTHYTQNSARATCHARPLRVWQSRVR